MSFLAPWFLLGALAVAAPLVFHLVRRTTREHTRFGSLMFLRPVPPRLTQRNRLEHLLLLALRCLVLVLLAAGFARPFLNRLLPAAPTGEPARRIVVLVDTSASMRRGELWSEALAKAAAVFRRASPADQLAVLTFDREVTPRMTFDQWNSTPVGERAARARAQLAAASPGWAATHLDAALIRAGELAAETDDTSGSVERQVILISDLQAGSHTGALQAYEWPKDVSVRIETLTPPTAGNAAIQWLPESDTATPAAEATTVRLRVVSAPDAGGEQFQLGWWRAGANDWAAPPQAVYLAPGQSRVVTLNVLTNPPADAVRLSGDAEPFDNTAYVVPPEPAHLPVLYLGREPEGDTRAPRFFLTRAFQPTPRRAVEVLAWNPEAAPAPPVAETAALAVVTTPITPNAAGVLRALLARGRCVLFVPPDATAAATIVELVPGTAVPVGEAQPKDYALLAEMDFRHPLFAPFADPRFSDFTKIRFWKHRRFDLAARPEARVLARFDSGDPAMFEMPTGAGRVVVWAAGWQTGESQLALSTKFVPLLHALLDLSAGAPPAAGQFLVGDAIPLPKSAAQTTAGFTVLTPDGTTVKLGADETQFTRTAEPGVYRVTAGATVTRWAVNLAPAESRVTPLPPDELERLGVPVAAARPSPELAAARETRLQRAELESRQKLWWWVLLATLAVLLTETALAGFAARRAALRTEAAP